MNGTQRETGREPKAKGEDSAAAAAWRPRPGLGCRAQFLGVGKVGARQPGRGRHARSLRSSTPPWGSPSPPAPPAHAAASDAPAPHARHGPLRAWARPACPAARRGGRLRLPFLLAQRHPWGARHRSPPARASSPPRLPEPADQGWRPARTCRGRHFAGAGHLRWRPCPSASVPTASPPSRPARQGGGPGWGAKAGGSETKRDRGAGPLAPPRVRVWRGEGGPREERK